MAGAMDLVPPAKVAEDTLYRIGLQPNPLVWPPRSRIGGGRYDDPERQFRTLYIAEQRRASFVEILAPFRRSAVLFHRPSPNGHSDWPADKFARLVRWCGRRCMGQLQLAPGQRWLDLRLAGVRKGVHAELAGLLEELGLEGLEITGSQIRHRRLTQCIARWAHDQGFAGIAYKSRFGDHFDCWAVFEGARFEPIGRPEPILPHDPDLRETVQLLGLSLI